MNTNDTKWLEAVRATRAKNAEVMTAPRAREQRRPPQRSVRALAAAALLALSGALALPATAQADVLVSNFGQPQSTSGATLNNRFLGAQGFSVASGGGDYFLDSIELRFNRRITPANMGLLTTSVWSADSSGEPANPLHTLINPRDIEITDRSNAVFTAQPGARLEAGNTYVVVADYNRASGSGWRSTRRTDEDAISLTDWTIGNGSLGRARAATSWSRRTFTLFLRVNGTPVPPPPPPGNLTASPGDGEVTLSWDAPASDWTVTRHEYRYKTEGNYGGGTTEGDYGDWTTMPDSGRGENNVSGYTVPRLVNGTVYTFQVRAVNGAGAGAAAESDPVTPALPSVVPTTCTLNPGDVWCGTVQVGEVAEASGKTIGYGFHETWHGAGVGYMHDGRINYGANSYTIDEAMVGVGATDRTDGFLFFGLNRALPSADRARLTLHIGSDKFAFSEAHYESSTHTYHWRNTGLDWSSTATVRPRLRASPAAPTAVTATAPPGTGGLLEVKWSAPASATGGSIRKYQVNYRKATVPESGNRRSPIAQTEAGETSLLLYALLDASTEYEVRVRARNAIGWGAWSEVATARTGAKQPTNPIVSLAVVDASGNDIDQITAGQTFRYRVKVTDLLNHHQSSGKDFTGWGTLGVRGPISIEYFNDDVRYGCHGETLFLEDFTWESFTTGYWEFDSVETPADAGPVRLQMGFECRGSHSETSEVARVTRTSKSFELGRPDTACLSVADSEGMVTACPAGTVGGRALKARFVSPPEHHDGSGRVKVRVAFSEPIEESPENVGEHGVQVEGGRVTSVRQVDNRPSGGAGGRSAGRSSGGQEDGESVWEFEIEPGSDDDLTMRIDAGGSCDEPGAICTADGRSLSEGIATTVEGPEPGPPALTASFVQAPAEHDGETAFKLLRPV